MNPKHARMTAASSILAVLLIAACAESDGGDASGTATVGAVQSTSGVSAMTDRDLYVAGEAGTAIFSNASSEAVFLPGCAPFVFEESLNGNWVFAGPPFVCVWEGFAVRVGASEELETQFDAPLDSGYYRLRYDYGRGCDAGEPLSRANCSSALVVYSDEFEVAREVCDPAEVGCRFLPAAPNVLCGDGVHFSGPSQDCTRDPASGECGYELLVCP